MIASNRSPVIGTASPTRCVTVIPPVPYRWAPDICSTTLRLPAGSEAGVHSSSHCSCRSSGGSLHAPVVLRVIRRAALLQIIFAIFTFKHPAAPKMILSFCVGYAPLTISAPCCKKVRPINAAFRSAASVSMLRLLCSCPKLLLCCAVPILCQAHKRHCARRRHLDTSVSLFSSSCESAACRRL